MCVCGLRTGRQGCSDGTKGPAVWEVIAKIASWQPLHHSQNTWLLSFLSVLWKSSWAERKKSCSSGWMCPYLNSHLRCHPCSLSSSCLVCALFCKLAVILLTLIYFSPRLPCIFSPFTLRGCQFSLPLYCTVIMMLPPNDVFGLKSFWHACSVCTLLHGGFLPALMWHTGGKMQTAAVSKPHIHILIITI